MIQIVFQFDKDKDALCEDVKDLIDLFHKYFPLLDESYEKRIAELEEKVRQLEQLADNGTVTQTDKPDANVSISSGNSEQDSETERDRTGKQEMKQDVVERATRDEINKDVRYFKIDGAQTQDSSAPFCAEIDGQGIATFQFNVKNGAHREYSEHPEKIEMFCDIEKGDDAPNHIRNIESGKCKIEGTKLCVIEKAKIRLEKE